MAFVVFGGVQPGNPNSLRPLYCPGDWSRGYPAIYRVMAGRNKGIKKGVRIKIQPRFKIQYPMKNRGKDSGKE